MALSTQKITTNAKTVVTTTAGVFTSAMLANNHASSDVTIDLYLTSQLGSDITDTDTNVNFGSGYATTTNNQVIVVDNGGTAGTSDMFLQERVYLSTGAFVGTCTTFTSATSITFKEGIETALTNDDSLYTGTRYYILNNVVIPNGSSLKLDGDEFSIDNNRYKMYILSNSSTGNIDIITTS